ncbi:MAG: hypothetical protein ACRD09_14725, partial [Vicinamibacterales bacterium]
MTTPTTPARAPRLSGRLPKRLWRWRWALAVLSVLLLAFVVTFVRYYATFGRMIDARLQGERTRAEPRVFARALELRPGQSLSPAQLSDRLNDLGYAHRARADKPGEFAIGREAIALIPRAGSHGARLMRIVFRRTGRPGSELNALERIEAVPKQRVDRLTLEPPLLTALVNSGREKRRMVPLAQIPKQLVNAVLAIEDRRFY